MIVSLMDSDHESGEQSLTHSEAVVSESDLFTPAKMSSLSSSSTSSSSDSSFDGDFFQLDESKLYEPIVSVDLVSKQNDGEVLGKPSITAESCPSPSGSENLTNEVSSNIVESYPSSSSENIAIEASPNTTESYPSSSGSENITTEASPNSEESDSGSPRSQQILDKAHFDTRDSYPGSSGSDGIPREVDFDSEESDLGSPDSISAPDSVQSGLVMQSPPIQVMERTNDTSTYRIPSSVFARSTTPVEWSVASNESLFSLHVGNNSFSRDQFILMDKAGELGKSGDLFYLKTEDYMLSNCPPPPLPVMDHEKKSPGLGGSLGVDEAATETMKEVLRANTEDQNKAKTKFAEETRTSSHRSDGSGASIYSFAFPIKKKKRCASLFCNCSNYCRAFCYCTWSSCSCSKCNPTCCHCRWPSCSCFKCKPACCRCKWPSCKCSNCFRLCSPCTWSFCNCSNPCRTCSSCSCSFCNCSNCFRACSCSTWPSCQCCYSCRQCSHCAWPSCSCCNCSRVCFHCSWPSCFSSNCCRSCYQCSWPSCSFPKCSGGCCHCFRCKRSCKLSNC